MTYVEIYILGSLTTIVGVSLYGVWKLVKYIKNVNPGYRYTTLDDGRELVKSKEDD
jgi:hypothetical protein